MENCSVSSAKFNVINRQRRGGNLHLMFQSFMTLVSRRSTSLRGVGPLGVTCNIPSLAFSLFSPSITRPSEKFPERDDGPTWRCAARLPPTRRGSVRPKIYNSHKTRHDLRPAGLRRSGNLSREGTSWGAPAGAVALSAWEWASAGVSAAFAPNRARQSKTSPAFGRTPDVQAKPLVRGRGRELGFNGLGIRSL